MTYCHLPEHLIYTAWALDPEEFLTSLLNKDTEASASIVCFSSGYSDHDTDAGSWGTVSCSLVFCCRLLTLGVCQPSLSETSFSGAKKLANGRDSSYVVSGCSGSLLSSDSCCWVPGLVSWRIIGIPFSNPGRCWRILAGKVVMYIQRYPNWFVRCIYFLSIVRNAFDTWYLRGPKPQLL